MQLVVHKDSLSNSEIVSAVAFFWRVLVERKGHHLTHARFPLLAATLFYNVALAIYYKLVILDSWRERRLKKSLIWFHAIPITIGFTLAFAGLPYYTWQAVLCYLPYFPFEDNMGVVLGIFVIPVCLSLAALLVIMVMIYCGVRKKYMISRKYVYGQGGASLQERVFWQSLRYVIAFLIPWPISVAAALRGGIIGSVRYWFGIWPTLLGPSQGFLNALIYFAPRVHLSVSEFLHGQPPRDGSGSIMMSLEEQRAYSSAASNAASNADAEQTEVNGEENMIEFPGPSRRISYGVPMDAPLPRPSQHSSRRRRPLSIDPSLAIAEESNGDDSEESQ